MSVERIGDEIVFRASGIGRFFSAAFLGVWLCGWAVGEVVAAGFVGWGAWQAVTKPELVFQERQAIVIYAGAALFILLWLALWTLGGVAALREFCRALLGRDAIRCDGSTLTVRSRGLGRRERTLERARIARLTLHARSGALLAEVDGKDELITDLGTRADREALLAELRERLGLAAAPPDRTPPDSWEIVTAPDGAIVLRPSPSRRRMQARVMAVIALAVDVPVAWLLVESLGDPRRRLADWLLLAGLVAIGALLSYGWLWLARGVDEWRFRRDGVERVRGVPGRIKREHLARGPLNLHVSIDSDSDPWYALHLDSPGKRLKIMTTAMDPRDSLRLGRALADATGWTFHSPPHLDA